MILFLLLFSLTLSINAVQLTCYQNASISLLSNTSSYANLSWESCQCLLLQTNVYGIQYDTQQQLCTVFENASSISNLQITHFSQVCFLSNVYLSTELPTTTTTTTVTTDVATTTTTTTAALPPITVGVSVVTTTNYQIETINMTNPQPITSLMIIIDVPKTNSLSNPSSYTNFWGGIATLSVVSNSTHVRFTFTLNQGSTIVAGSWNIAAQFNIIGSSRYTGNDTYSVQILPYSTIYGTF